MSDPPKVFPIPPRMPDGTPNPLFVIQSVGKGLRAALAKGNPDSVFAELATIIAVLAEQIVRDSQLRNETLLRVESYLQQLLDRER